MILDGANLDPKKLPKYDICIVGAGAVGFAMAQKLLDKKKKSGDPINVVVLDSGIKNVPDGHGAGERRFYDPIVQPLDEGVNGAFLQKVKAADSRDFFTRSRTRCYGGSTNCWGGWIRPLDSYDFDTWPISYQEIEKYYPAALKLVSLDHFDIFDKAEEWTKLTAFDTQVLKPAVDSTMKDVVIQQQTNTDIIDFQTQFGSIFEEANSNLTLIKNATALQLSFIGEMVDNILCGSLKDSGTQGQSFNVSAYNFVLAMGGIETPRFLMINGLHNKLTDIGKYYMNHPKYLSVGKLKVENPAIFGMNAAQSRFYGTVTQLKSYPSQLVQCYIVPTHATMTKKGAEVNNYRVALGYDQSTHEANVELNFEQSPNINSALSLDYSSSDAFLKPRIKLDWQFSRKDAATVNACINQVVRRVGNQLGPTDKVKPLTWFFDSEPFPPVKDTFGGAIYTGDHHMGTCRMRPTNGNGKDGVVNGDLQVFGYNNFWICSTGVYPKGGWANATLTLLALSLRLTDNLLSKYQ